MVLADLDVARHYARRQGRAAGGVRTESHKMPVSPERARLLSVGEAAALLGISAGTLRNWISMRRIEHVKVGRLTRLSVTAIDRYIAAHTIGAIERQA